VQGLCDYQQIELSAAQWQMLRIGDETLHV